MNARVVLTSLVVLSVTAGRTSNAQHASMPPGMTHQEHLAQIQKDAELKERGNRSMAFDQDKTSHHFVLTTNGGIIQVEVVDAADRIQRDLIRTHLREIASDFASGLFDKPFATHAEVPPGVPAMQRLKSAISYAFEETPLGGLVRIDTRDPGAAGAVHAFLKYQIAEHRTGDSVVVQSR